MERTGERKALYSRFPPKVAQGHPTSLSTKQMILWHPGRDGRGREGPGDPPWVTLQKLQTKPNDAGRPGTAVGCSVRSRR
jgi:hypothetical protein